MNGMDIWFFWKLSTIYFVTKRYPTVSSRLFPITKYHCKVKSMGKGLYEALTWYCGFSTVPVMVRFLCWEKLSSWLSLFQSLNKHFDWRIVSNTARKWFALIMKAKGLNLTASVFCTLDWIPEQINVLEMNVIEKLRHRFGWQLSFKPTLWTTQPHPFLPRTSNL